eukprot:COSAG04_NODE_4535_length_2028_cov_1.738725_2_plen_280_part_00
MRLAMKQCALELLLLVPHRARAQAGACTGRDRCLPSPPPVGPPQSPSSAPLFPAAAPRNRSVAAPALSSRQGSGTRARSSAPLRSGPPGSPRWRRSPLARAAASRPACQACSRSGTPTWCPGGSNGRRRTAWLRWLTQTVAGLTETTTGLSVAAAPRATSVRPMTICSASHSRSAPTTPFVLMPCSALPSSMPFIAALVVPAPVVGRAVKAASPIRAMRPNAMRVLAVSTSACGSVSSTSKDQMPVMTGRCDRWSTHMGRLSSPRALRAAVVAPSPRFP